MLTLIAHAGLSTEPADLIHLVLTCKRLAAVRPPSLLQIRVPMGTSAAYLRFPTLVVYLQLALPALGEDVRLVSSHDSAKNEAKFTSLFSLILQAERSNNVKSVSRCSVFVPGVILPG